MPFGSLSAPLLDSKLTGGCGMMASRTVRTAPLRWDYDNRAPPASVIPKLTHYQAVPQLFTNDGPS